MFSFSCHWVFFSREISDVFVDVRGISTRLPNVESRVMVFHVLEEVHMVRLIADLSKEHESAISVLAYEDEASTVFLNDDFLGLIEGDSFHLPQVEASVHVVPNFPFRVVVCRIDFYDPAFITWLFFIAQGVERVRLLIIRSNSLVINTMASVLQLQGMSMWGFLKLGIIGSEVGIVAWRQKNVQPVLLRSDEQLFHCLLRRRLGLQSLEMDHAPPQHPPRDQLSQETQHLISNMENLILVNYPNIMEDLPLPIVERPFLAQILRTLVDYHFQTGNHANEARAAILQWIGIDNDDLGPARRLLYKLQSPVGPDPHTLQLGEAEHNFAIDGSEKVAYVFRAQNIIQAQIGIQVGINLAAQTVSYALRFSFGRPDALSELGSAAHPFIDPTNLTILHYNARGAALPSFKGDLLYNILEYDPEIVIITEIGLGFAEAHAMGTFIDYPPNIRVAPTPYSLGILLFSDMTTFSMDEKKLGLATLVNFNL
ncbi:hypothetical protein COLO4_10394 [Corchorus olitorius]|uniref:Uncharacterized protein n=1 Tax=Corchorus olitorius TaxID=93759 RepID=A0A1R3K8P8_9ROSI|nr:hypothetical protein COLO4_10394 [Corchorus olitorius]